MWVKTGKVLRRHEIKLLFFVVFTTTLCSATAAPCLAESIIWRGGNGDGYMLSANWIGSAIPGSSDTAVFRGGTDDQPIISSDCSVRGILFEGDSEDYNKKWDFEGSGHILSLTSGDGIDTSTNFYGTVFFDCGVNILKNKPTFDIMNGTVTINGPITASDMVRNIGKKGNGELILSSPHNNFGFIDLAKGKVSALTGGSLGKTFVRISGAGTELYCGTSSVEYSADLWFWRGGVTIAGGGDITFNGTNGYNAVRGGQQADITVSAGSGQIVFQNGFIPREMTTSIVSGETEVSSKVRLLGSGLVCFGGHTDLNHSGRISIDGQIEVNGSICLSINGTIRDTLLYGRSTNSCITGSGEIIFTDAMLLEDVSPLLFSGVFDARSMKFDLSGATAIAGQQFIIAECAANSGEMFIPSNPNVLLNDVSARNWRLKLSEDRHALYAEYVPWVGTLIETR